MGQFSVQINMSGAHFPHNISIPAFVGLPGNQLSIFPGTSWFKTPAMLEAKAWHSGYNFSEGRLATPAELKLQYPHKASLWSIVLKRAEKQVQLANSDSNHSSRWQLATQALNAFLVMFVAATGMNWAQVLQLSWSNDFEIFPERQGFRTVKWRARGKRVFFELPIAFVPSFKRYLELRKYLLQNFSSDLLFFTSAKISAPPGPILSTLRRTYELLQRIDPAIPVIMAKQWRSAKSDWLIRNTDPSTTALILQNTERTVLRSYAAGSEISHYEEMGEFLRRAKNAATSATMINVKSTAVGACTRDGEPSPLAAQVPLNPDCTRSEGCLFCLHHKAHADEKDARKLLSCRYVINLASPLSDSEESFQKSSGQIIARIDSLITEIAAFAQEMVARIRYEVEVEGKLDPYWEGKLKMLITLGL